VRTRRFAGGSSIDGTVTAAPGVPVWNIERLLAESRGEPTHEIPYYHEEARAVLKTLDNLLRAYNYDGSDTMTDYFDVNFYQSIDFSHGMCEADRAKALKMIGPATFPSPSPTTKPDPDPKPETAPLSEKGTAIRFDWSESGEVNTEKVFTTFAEADAELKRAEKLEFPKGPDGTYRKTGFTISIEGETYQGRYDIGSDAPTLAEHMIAFADPAQNGFLKDGAAIAHYAMWANLVRATVALEKMEPSTVVLKLPVVFFSTATLQGVG